MNQNPYCRISFFIFTFLFCSASLQAQTKTKDIDALYQKYKNRDTIVISNANGSVKLAVEITLNSNGKPQSIVLKGYADNSTLAESIISKLENNKQKAGYKYNSFTTVVSDEILNVTVYTKGKEYAKYGVDRDIFGKDDPPPYDTGTEEQKKRRAQQYFFLVLMHASDSTHFHYWSSCQQKAPFHGLNI